MAYARPVSRLALAAAASLPGLALAHAGHGEGSGFMMGFSHPFGGFDHLLAMIAVGMFAAGLGGRALWAVPLAFVSFMLVGGALGAAGIALPFVEAGIALSIVVFGVAVATKRRWPVGLAMALVAGFAIFHGHAHATEMPADASGAAYAAGFVGATILLHLTGLLIGLAIGRADRLRAPRFAQFGGMAVAVAGLGILLGVV